MKNTRILTEGALLLAIFTILLLLFIYIPFLSIVSAVILTLPFLIYSAKYPLKFAFILLIASLLISALVGSILAIPVAILYGTTGSVMGYCIQLHKSKTTLYISTSITFLINIMIEYIISIAFFKIDFLKDSIKMFKESFNQSAKFLESFGQAQQTDQLLDQFNKGISLIPTMLPTLFVFSAFFVVWIIISVNLPIARRFGIEVPKWSPFREMQLPKSVLWYYLITVVLTIIFKPDQSSYLYMALVNLSFILQLLMLLQGFSLIYYFGYVKKWSKSILVIVTIFSILIFPLQYIIRVLGIVDLGFNIRQHIQPKE